MVAGSIFFMTGARAQGQSDLVSTNPADIQAGQLLYQASCQSCHGFQGEGGQTSAPALVSAGAAAADFYLTTGRMPLNNPANQPIRHRPYFNPLQIRQLVAYINALPVLTDNPPGRPSPPWCRNVPGRPAAGLRHSVPGPASFAINCAQCHHAAGSGGMLSKGNVVPSLRNADLTQVAEATRVGPGRCRCSARRRAQRAHVSGRPLRAVPAPPLVPGGLGIAFFGPVREGFVGVVIGFRLLWFAIRMIG